MSATPSIKDLEAQLAEAQLAAEKAENSYSDVAYQFSLGKVSEDDLASARGANRHAIDRVADLERAVAGARKAHQDAIVAAKASAKQKSLNALRQHLAARSKAVATMLKAANDLVVAWEDVVEKSEKIAPLVPPAALGAEAGIDVALITLGSINNLLGTALYKASFPQAVARDPTSPARIVIPGSRIPPFRYIGQPDLLPTAEAEIHEANEWLLRNLTSFDGDFTPALPVARKKLPPVAAPAPAHRADPNARKVIVAAPDVRHASADSAAGRAELERDLRNFLPAERAKEVLTNLPAAAPPVADKAAWLAEQRKRLNKE